MRLEPTAENGLNKTSYVMTDEIVTVNRKLLGYRFGVVGDRYGHGSGLTVLIDGRTLHDDSDHPSITVPLPAYVQ